MVSTRWCGGVIRHHESDDAFEIAIEGLTVTQCRFDYAVTLVLDDGTTSFTIRIAEPFALRVGAGGTDAWSVDPEHRPPEGAPVLALLDLAAKRLLAIKDGRLQLSFDGDWSVEVPSGTHYEAWQLHRRRRAPPVGFRTWRQPRDVLAIEACSA